MSKLSLENFVDCYIEAVLEALEKNPLNLNIFYEHIYGRVSEKTGHSRDEIKSVHHPFHWNLFLKKESPLELVTSGRGGNGYEIHVRQENSLPKKPELVSSVLKEYGTLLQKKLEKIQK